MIVFLKFDRAPQIENLISTFEKLSKKVSLLPDNELKDEILMLTKNAKTEAFRLIRQTDISTHLIPDRVRTGAAVNDLIHTIGGALLEQRLEKVRNSPVFSLMIDESTDKSMMETLTMNFICIVDGMKKSFFIDIIHILGTTAKAIFGAIKSFFAMYHLDWSKLYGFGSNGASNMRGG